MECMLATVKSSADSLDKAIDRSVVRTDVLIDCIRTTSNQQVMNSALLLTAALADIMPDLVLHSVMPIFTFLGANVLRRDDDFSAYVVKQTMDSVIPCLIKSLNKGPKGKTNLLSGVSELLLSFAAAFEHIAVQRRLDLFVSLTDKVGPKEYLFALLIILVDKYGGDPKTTSFVIELISHYDPQTRVVTVKQYLDVVLDARSVKPTLSTPLLVTAKSRHSDVTTANLLPAVSAILGNARFASEITAVLGQPSEEADVIRTTYTLIVERIFVISGEVKDKAKLYALSIKSLDTSLTALPVPRMIDTLRDLLDRTDDDVGLRLLAIFFDRIEQMKSSPKVTQEACLEFLARLLQLIEKSNAVALRRLAIRCVDTIIEKFGKKNVECTMSAGRAMSGEKCLGAGETSLQVASLLCLATFVEVTGESGIRLLPASLGRALDLLSFCVEDAADDPALHNAAYTFTSALLLYVPWIITANDADRLLHISYESANAGLGVEYDIGRTEALRLIPQQL